jgi:nucleotide-binding universal stress UspA family protein
MESRTILAAVDFDPLCQTTLDAAAHCARRGGANRVHVVHVVRPIPAWAVGSKSSAVPVVERAFDEAFQETKRRVETLSAPAESFAITHETLIGPPAPTLVQTARAIGAGLIVLAGHDRTGVDRFLSGSVANAVLRSAHCPVLIVGAQRPGLAPFRKVVAAIDLSPAAARVLHNAQSFADRREGEITVLSVAELDGFVGRLPQRAEGVTVRDAMVDLYTSNITAVAQASRSSSLPMRIDVRELGSVREIIRDAAEKADLLVIGTSGHHAWQRLLLGSTAGWVSTEARCPVLVCPMPYPS